MIVFLVAHSYIDFSPLLKDLLYIPPSMSNHAIKSLRRNYLYQAKSKKFQISPASRPCICRRMLPEARSAIRSKMPEQVQNIREERMRRHRPK